MIQRYRRIEDQKPGPELPCNQDFAKGEDLNQKLKCLVPRGFEPKVKMYRVLSCLVTKILLKGRI